MSGPSSFAAETGAEILKSLRAPEFILPTLLLPVAFYWFFAVATPGAAGGQAAVALLATYGVFAVMGPSLFGFGVGVATEREKGWLQLKRVAPASGFVFILSKLVTTVLFASLAVALVYAVAGFGGGVALSRGTWITLLAVHVFAAMPFVLLGLTLGFTFGANGAVAVTNLLFLGLASLGGLWLPIGMFPDFLREIAIYLPSYHLGQLAISVVRGAPVGEAAPHLIAVFGMTAGFALIAAVAWSRQR